MLLYNDTEYDQTDLRDSGRRRIHSKVSLYRIDTLPAISSRITAEIIDRVIASIVFPLVIALPMVVIGREFFVPIWLFVTCAWHLLRDCSPNQRSTGKRLCRLRVVMSNGRGPCPLSRRIFRRIGSMLSQMFYLLAVAIYIPFFGISDSAKHVAVLLFSLVGLPRPGASILMLSALLYDIISLIVISISTKGRRLEDLLTRTRVISESDYHRR